MANAEIYSKWSSQGDGNRGGGGWSGPHGSGRATFNGGGIIAINQHAERVAWKQAWPEAVRKHIRDSQQQFQGQTYQIKFWVDQQICPDCQKWLTVDVIAHLKQLSRDFNGLRVDLFAEVLFNNATKKIKVQRTAVWPVEIGNKATFAEM